MNHFQETEVGPRFRRSLAYTITRVPSGDGKKTRGPLMRHAGNGRENLSNMPNKTRLWDSNYHRVSFVTPAPNPGRLA